MEQNVLSFIAVVTGLIGAIAGLYAAFTAYRSAGMAKSAAKHAQETDRRGLAREVSSITNKIVAESVRVDDIANKLKQSYRALAVFNGQTNGSRPELFIESVADQQKHIVPLQQEAIDLLDKRDVFRKFSEEELTQLLLKIEGNLLHIRRVKEKFMLDLESVERDIQTFRGNTNQ